MRNFTSFHITSWMCIVIKQLHLSIVLYCVIWQPECLFLRMERYVGRINKILDANGNATDDASLVFFYTILISQITPRYYKKTWWFTEKWLFFFTFTILYSWVEDIFYHLGSDDYLWISIFIYIICKQRSILHIVENFL